MDFTKFVAMLVTKSLYLTRVDKLRELGDSFEGSFPNPPKKRALVSFLDKNDRERYYAEKIKAESRFYYVNCWHGNDSESDAMWKIYVKGNQGIAVRSTFQKLRDSLQKAPQTIWIGKVNYLDDFTWSIVPTDPTIHACMAKRKCFRHEEEIRLIWLDENKKRTGHTGQDGKEIQCFLPKLIDKVYLAPPNSPWFKRVVENVLRRYRINAEVVQSDIG
ncbi:MAG: hypothetical protein HQ552_12010 [Desulfobacteraceae bacterium]|nr:hypothetical protein [Desulfobacteraceae bacterium]